MGREGKGEGREEGVGGSEEREKKGKEGYEGDWKVGKQEGRVEKEGK